MSTLHDQLAAAVAGLTERSARGEPFETFIWSSIGVDPVDQVERHTADIGEAVPTDDWFARRAGADDGGRYAELRAALDGMLTGLTVVRVGQGPRVGVYLVGKAADGRWAGVRTVSVEA